MVRYLIGLGANVDAETNVRLSHAHASFSIDCAFQLMFTPLHSAAQQGHVMIVKLLLDRGASPNKTDKVGREWRVTGRCTHGNRSLSLSSTE